MDRHPSNTTRPKRETSPLNVIKAECVRRNRIGVA